MSYEIEALDAIVNLALFVVVLLLIPCGYRVWKGPQIADRLLAIDLMTTLIVGIMVLFALIDGIPMLVDLGLAMAALSFIATMGIARYVADGKVF